MPTPNWEIVIRTIHDGEQPTPEQWQLLTAEEQELISLLQQEKLMPNAVELLNNVQDDRAWLRLSGKMKQPNTGRSVRLHILRYAAVITGICLLGIAMIFYFRKESVPQTDPVVKNQTAPVNRKRAVLVLDDGSSIALDQHPDAKIIQGQTTINNIDTSLLRYTAEATTVQPAGFNTLIVPRGGLYTIELADGSTVWLNAETKLRYPTHFGGVAKRTVYLESGEAYFKVKKNTALPFVVKTGDMEVQVLGTEFNVNVYTKNITTTLVTGAVQLNAGGATALLKPGQQALFSEGKFIRKGVDVETYTAWKDGQLIFEETTLETVMETIGRQFDFTISFTSGALKQKMFGGRLKRTEQIEDVLSIIEKAGHVQFTIRGKTIYVSPVMSK